MSDTIFLKGLALHAYHGVMQHEAKVGQTFYVDLQLDLELANASRTDKLKDTVSYDFVVKTVAEAFAAAATDWWKRFSRLLASLRISPNARNADVSCSTDVCLSPYVPARILDQYWTPFGYRRGGHSSWHAHSKTHRWTLALRGNAIVSLVASRTTGQSRRAYTWATDALAAARVSLPCLENG